MSIIYTNFSWLDIYLRPGHREASCACCWGPTNYINLISLHAHIYLFSLLLKNTKANYTAGFKKVTRSFSITLTRSHCERQYRIDKRKRGSTQSWMTDFQKLNV